MPNEHLSTPSVPNALPKTTPDFAFYRQVDTLTGAGTTQADAASIVSGSGSAIVLAGANNSGVILPPISFVGQEYVLRNNSANTIKVYPATGATINALSANAAFAMATVTGTTIIATSATAWLTVPVVPS